jgi:[protein-PII] uridylyltransferase
MQSESRISPLVLLARDKLAQGRSRIANLHNAGALGVQISLQLTQLYDDIVLDLYQSALTDCWENQATSLLGQVALIAHGGYGRSDIAPYSDVDLMLLHQAKSEEILTPLVRKFTHSMFDTGLQLGFSVRTPAQACELARGDASILTALTESRLMHGEETLFCKFMERIKRETRRSAAAITAIEAARGEESGKYGETVYLLEPNIKRSRGGLRDLQFIRWLGFVQHNETDLESLKQLGMLSIADWRRLRDAREFLLRLRNDMHFHANKAQDGLDRPEQIRLAKLLGYSDQPGLLAVEQFMRTYFEHTENVCEIATFQLERARPRSTMQRIIDPLFSHSVENDFRVGPSSIWATASGLAKIKNNMEEVLRLLEFAALYDKPIDLETWDTIRQSTADLADRPALPQLPHTIRSHFFNLLEQPARLGQSLRYLHALRLLEHIIPAAKHTRCLLQFNSYHKYTVDEHTLRAVEIVASYLRAHNALGDAYRAIKHKRVLHLAMLLHDMGKGFEEDHSEVGRRIALETGARLGFAPEETDMVAFLVHKHLRMAHIAQRHDIHDPQVVVPFAAEVGSPEMLRMLFVLTCADITAVGPNVLNDWKFQLLNDLYKQTLHLFSDTSPEEAADARVRHRREAIAKVAAHHADQAWWRRHIAALPANFILATKAERIVEELNKLRELPKDDAVAWGRYLPERNAVEYTVGTHEGITAGIFHKLTGTLACNGQQILSAEIHTLADGLILDRFYVEDCDVSGAPPQPRLDQICSLLVNILKQANAQPPVFRRVWKMQDRQGTAELNRVPTQVHLENDTSEQFTIAAIFTYDRMGLLYSIAHTLFEDGLSIARAKIGTHLDQVVDVFYLTETATGKKVTSPEKIAQIRQNLMQTLSESTV